MQVTRPAAVLGGRINASKAGRTLIIGEQKW